MQARRQVPLEEGKALPKALQNSPYASSSLAPGLQKKIYRHKTPEKAHQHPPSIAASSSKRHPRSSSELGSGGGKRALNNNNQSNDNPDIFAPSPEKNATSTHVNNPNDGSNGVIAYRHSTNPKKSNSTSVALSPRNREKSHGVSLPDVKGSINGPAVALLKSPNQKCSGSKSATTIRSNDLALLRSNSQSSAFEMRNVGLSNLGNTCFMNSALQCILHVKPLVVYFTSGEFEKDINERSPLKGKLAVAFGELVRDIFSKASGQHLSPNNFKKNIAKMAPHLLDFEQQDSQEFLRFLLDGLSEDLGRKKNLIKNDIGGDDVTKANSSLLTLALGEDNTPPSPTTPSSSGGKNSPKPPTNSKPSLPDRLRSKIRSESSAVSVQRSMFSDRVDEMCSKEDREKTSNQEYNELSNLDSDTHIVANTRRHNDNAHKEASKAWSQYLEKNDSVITDIFGGQLQSTIECLTCNTRSHCFDPFLDLSIPIEIPGDKVSEKDSVIRSKLIGGRRNFRDPSSCKLEDCLASFSSVEILDGDNAYNCEKCKKKQRSSKRLSIYKYPQVLIIHIKRYRYTAIRKEKVNTDVKFPHYGLDLSAYLSTDSLELIKMEDSPRPIYDLAGVANHSGGMNGGHYVAYVDGSRDPGSNTQADQDWFCFNDCRVSPSSISSSGGPSAYLLFYRLRVDNSSKIVQI